MFAFWSFFRIAKSWHTHKEKKSDVYTCVDSNIRISVRWFDWRMGKSRVRVRVRVRVRIRDWRFTANQFVLATSPLRLKISNFICQPNICDYSLHVTSSLTRGWSLQLLLIFASAVILRSESLGTHDHISLSLIRDSRNLEGQVPVYISPRNKVARFYPQALGSLFVASYDSQGYGGGILSRLHMGMGKGLQVAPLKY
jgi:hypothetical protein